MAKRKLNPKVNEPIIAVEDISGKREVVVSFDISTSCTGVCVLDYKTGDLVLLAHKRLDKFDDEYEKGDNFSNDWIDPTWNVKRVYIEEAAKKFTSGFSSAGTIMTLGRFNGIISYMVYKWWGVKPTMVSVRSARSRLGIKIDYKDKTTSTKDKVGLIVRTMHPEFPWVTKVAKAGKFKGQTVLEKFNEDMVDAWVIGAAGRIMFP